MKTAGLRSVVSLFSISLVLYAGLVPSLARCGSGRPQGVVESAAIGTESHAGMAGHYGSSASADGWTAPGSGTVPDTSCCIAMLSCSSPCFSGGLPPRLGTIGLRAVSALRLTVSHSSLLPAPESPPPKL